MDVGTQSVVITGIICVLWWMVAYVAIIYRGFRDRSYGMPVAALGANLSWEFIYSFLLDPFTDQIHILSIPCFVIDLVIAYQCLRYGARSADIPLVRRYFPWLVAASVAIAFPVVYLGFYEFNDPAGEYTGFGINFMMSMLFVAMLLRRDSSAGQSMWIAISKWQGTLFAWIATAVTVTTDATHQPQSFRGSEVWLLIVLTPVLGVLSVCCWDGGCAGFPGCPGAHRLRPRRAGPPSVSLGWFVLVRRVRAGRRAAASRSGTPRPRASRR